MKVAASINAAEPGAVYYKGLEQLAMAALRYEPSEFGHDQAYALCEYLDCVDSGAWPSAPTLYRRCVAEVTGYLERCPRQGAHALSRKSWAAHTLLGLICQTNTRVGSRCAALAG